MGQVLQNWGRGRNIETNLLYEYSAPNDLLLRLSVEDNSIALSALEDSLFFGLSCRGLDSVESVDSLAQMS